jgi:hypothetical protein
MTKKGEQSIISSFKKFSEISTDKRNNQYEESELSEHPFDDDDLPANPNVPKRSERTERPMSTNYMMPSGQNVEPENPSKSIKTNESQVEFYGKVAKLPKGTKASKGYNFLENVKVSKSSIWYLMVEKQDNQLQMVKYNHKKGVDLSKFIQDLKEYYKSKYSDNKKVLKLIEAIVVDGNDKFSKICNIPLIEIEGKKIITKITEDLIRLLSK